MLCVFATTLQTHRADVIILVCIFLTLIGAGAVQSYWNFNKSVAEPTQEKP